VIIQGSKAKLAFLLSSGAIRELIIKKRGHENMEPLEFRYDTQLLIEGENLDEDEISDYITEHFKGDCLLAVGDEELIKIHFHTNEPWKILEYGASIGEIYDIVVEDMDRQQRGLHG
jgi:dihydroxyacetone kinase-like predicted kinase